MPVLHDCSLITLAHNGARFTDHWLANLLAAEDLPREIFLIDNASEDRTPSIVENAARELRRRGVEFVTWRNEQNVGCSRARNVPWQHANGRYTVFMDNDAAVCTSNWLTRLIRPMEQDPELAILGPKMIYPFLPHPIQCAGAGLTPQGRVWFRGRGCPRHETRFCEFRTVPLLISACWIMRTDLRDRIGMLDERFHPVQYEDLDLCLRAWQDGLRVAYTPDVEMYHFEGITTESFGTEEYRRTIARNSAKFRQKWHHLFAVHGDPADPADLHWKSREEMGLEPVLDTALSTA
ncbi:MAG: glycosyltransferase family 2 protein [bacterium]